MGLSRRNPTQHWTNFVLIFTKLQHCLRSHLDLDVIASVEEHDVIPAETKLIFDCLLEESSWFLHISQSKKFERHTSSTHFFFFNLIVMLGNYEPTCIVTIKMVTMKPWSMVFIVEAG